MPAPLFNVAVSVTIAGVGPTGKVEAESKVVRVVAIGVGEVLMTKRGSLQALVEARLKASPLYVA
jgi:hypothetical protein